MQVQDSDHSQGWQSGVSSRSLAGLKSHQNHVIVSGMDPWAGMGSGAVSGSPDLTSVEVAADLGMSLDGAALGHQVVEFGVVFRQNAHSVNLMRRRYDMVITVKGLKNAIWFSLLF